MPSGHVLGHSQVATTAYGVPMYVPPAQAPRKHRLLKVLAVVLPVALVLGAGGVAAWFFLWRSNVYATSQYITLSDSWKNGATKTWSADVTSGVQPYVIGNHFLTLDRSNGTLTGYTPLSSEMKEAWHTTLDDEELSSSYGYPPSFQAWGDNTLVYKSTLVDLKSGDTSKAPWGDDSSATIAGDTAISCKEGDKCTAWDANQKQKWSRDIPGTGEASTFTFLRNELTLTRDGRCYICLYNIVINIDSEETLILGGGSRADTDLRTMYFKDGWGTYKEDKKDSIPDSESPSETRLEEGYSGGGGVGVEHGGGCDGLRECVQGASVVLLEDLPGLDVGVDLLDDVSDSVDAAADLLGDVGELFPSRFPGWGDHPSSDVALVGDPSADVEALEQAGGVQGGDIVGRARAGVRDPHQATGRGDQDLDVEPGALVLARPQLGVGLPAPAGHQGAVQDVVEARDDILGGDEVALQGAGDQLGQRLDRPGDGGLGHAEQLTDGGLGKVVAQVDQCRLQRPGHPEDRGDGVERFALGDPLGQLGELMGTQPVGTLHCDGSFPYGAFVWRQEFAHRNEPSPLRNTPTQTPAPSPE